MTEPFGIASFRITCLSMKAWQLSDWRVEREGPYVLLMGFQRTFTSNKIFGAILYFNILSTVLFIAKPFSFGRSLCLYCTVVWSSDGGASMCHALPGVRRILGATLDTETAGSAFTHYLGLGSALALAVCKPNPHHQLMTQCSQNEVNAVRWAE